VHGGGAGPRSGNPDTVIAYNSSGNPTARSGNALTFDAYNQLTAYGSVMSAGYMGDGLRAWKQTSAGRTYFLYEGATPVVEMNSSGTVTATMYDAYGVGQSTGSPSDPWGYGAQWGYFTDRETGLALLTHRYYDPSAGRFLNRDPIGLAGGT
jgi:RHS repeat-associated protein